MPVITSNGRRNIPDGLLLIAIALASIFAGAAVGLALGRRRLAGTEARLAESEARAKAILDAAVDGIVTIDEGGRIQSFNRAAERIFGYRAAEVTGRNVSVLMPDPYQREHDSYLRNYLVTGVAKIIGIGREVVGLRKDGTVFPMDLAVGESRLGGRRIFAGMVRDISDRKAVEERLRASEERFRVLVEGVRDYAIALLDPDGLIISWNTGGERLYGWAYADVIGMPVARFYAAEDVAAGLPRQSLDKAAREGRSEDEGWRLRKDGGRFWAHVITTALTGPGGELRGFARISRDTTAAKLNEDALKQARDEAVAAREAAERANVAKTKFLAAASHDLRQPVQAIFFFASVLAHKIGPSHAAAPVLDDLQASVEGLNMLLDSLLDISKLDAGLVVPKTAVFSVGAILDRTAAEFQQAAAAKGVRLAVVPSSATVRSDPALLSRIVQNLTSNAIRYTARGRILLGCRRVGEALRIEVWDTGMGIPEERTREIFEEFTQLGNPERDRTQGLGLGLAIVDRLARLMGHRVEVRSTPGRGSVFSVEVPLAAPPRVRKAAPARAVAEGVGGRLVVLIDDEPIVLKGLSMALESWGYQVLAATSEAEAVDLLRGIQERPSLILADYRLREGLTGT
ncbi:MAG: PAS domain S-box protein, partial [Pseudomonadota bacterium]